MIRINSFVIERTVDFITTLEEDIARQFYEHCFHELFPAFQYDIIHRIPELISFVYMSRIKTNIVNVYFTNLDRLCEIVHFPNLFVGNSINKTRKSLDIV